MRMNSGNVKIFGIIVILSCLTACNQETATQLATDIVPHTASAILGMAPLHQKPTIKVKRLARTRFAITGDHRPPKKNEINSYPAKVVEAIFKAIDEDEAVVVGDTGDQVYVDRGCPADTIAAQVNILLAARAHLKAPIHTTLGNHEFPCLQVMRMLGEEAPYYWWFLIEDEQGRRAKFVSIATDVWKGDKDRLQAKWLKTVMAIPTEYTFVLRHQYFDSHGTTPWIEAEIKAILQRHNITLYFAGHDHKYEHVKNTLVRGHYRDVIVGNGGAAFHEGWENPFNGYALVEFLPNGNVEVTAKEVFFDRGTTTRDRFEVTP